MYGVCSGTDFNTCVLHNAHLPANAVSRKDGVLLHMLNRIFIVCKCAQFYSSTSNILTDQDSIIFDSVLIY